MYISLMNYTSYFGHVQNFQQYLYWSVLVNSESFLLVGFVNCTLLQLYSFALNSLYITAYTLIII